MANFWIYSLRRSCLVSVVVSCSRFIKTRSGDLFVFVPWPIPWVSYHSRLFECLSLSPPSASTGQEWSVPEWSGPDSLTLYPRVPRETSWTIVHPSLLGSATVYVVLLEFSSRCAFDRMPACHEVSVRPYQHKSPSDVIWNVSIHSWSFELHG